MKVFRVVTERDGETVKRANITTHVAEFETATEIKRIDRRYAAETLEEVWEAISPIRNDPHETLVAIIEEHPAINIIQPEENEA